MHKNTKSEISFPCESEIEELFKLTEGLEEKQAANIHAWARRLQEKLATEAVSVTAYQITADANDAKRQALAYKDSATTILLRDLKYVSSFGDLHRGLLQAILDEKPAPAGRDKGLQHDPYAAQLRNTLTATRALVTSLTGEMNIIATTLKQMLPVKHPAAKAIMAVIESGSRHKR